VFAGQDSPHAFPFRYDAEHMSKMMGGSWKLEFDEFAKKLANEREGYALLL
jgi:hypothetical protein